MRSASASTNAPEPGAARFGRGRRALLASVAVAMVMTAGCASRPTDRPRSLVLVVIDTLRGDRPGYSGYPYAVTPTLDSLATVGTRFTRVMTPVPVTLPAMASLLTGRQPYHHGVRDNDRFRLDAAEVTLAERFRERGARTSAVVASAVLAADRGLAQGFDHYDAEFQGPYPVYTPAQRTLAEMFATTRRRADRVTDLALEQLRSLGDEPFFLLVHYFDVHMYLDPPPPYAALHPGRPYDGETSFVDAQLGRLLAAVRGRDDLLLVVTADHGEAQGEHGEPQHGFLLYESTLHVPLVVTGPGAPSGAIRDDEISLVDLGTTLFDVFDLPLDDQDGRALTWDRPEAEPVPLYAETFRPLVSYGWRELRAVREGRWKFIQGPPDELYDLQADPHEQRDLGATPEAERLGGWLRDLTRDDDPERVVARGRSQPDPGRRELLESLGYVGGSTADAEPTVDRPHPREELPRWMRQQWTREELRRAMVLLQDGAHQEAETCLDSVLAHSPEAADGWYFRGLARAELGDTAAALADHRACLERDPDHVHALAALARLAAKRGDGRAAFDLWSRVFAVDEDHPSAVMNIANWHLERDDPEAALPFLRRLVGSRPEDPVVRFNLGVAAKVQGLDREAREAFEAYLELDPNGPWARDARIFLESDR